MSSTSALEFDDSAQRCCVNDRFRLYSMTSRRSNARSVSPGYHAVILMMATGFSSRSSSANRSGSRKVQPKGYLQRCAV
ncbi:MAG: hypothetical protein ACLTXL_00215 [Clostridia bacterium]